MSTNCYIFIQNSDKSAERIYVHWDGYPTGVGDVLLNHYTTESRVRELFSFGNVSELHRELYPPAGAAKPLLDSPIQRGYTVFYGRDMGQQGEEAQRISAEAYAAHVSNSDMKWQYMFLPDGNGGGTWWCKKSTEETAVPLEDAITEWRTKG